MFNETMIVDYGIMKFTAVCPWSLQFTAFNPVPVVPYSFENV
jgi:hypothetical protein